MLTHQFFTRVQLAKILNFKSDSIIKDFEKKGFLTPQIKPSKYTFNQVLFMMICKEITDVTNLSWKYFIDIKFNDLLKQNLIDYNLLLLSHSKNTMKLDVELKNDDTIVKDLNNYLDSCLLNRLSKLKGSDNIDYKYLPSFHLYNDNDYILFTFSIDRINQKLHNKCIELKIDLKEKYSKSISDNTGSNIVFEYNQSVKKVELTAIH